MSTANQNTISGLNHLLARNMDASNGYVEVANNITFTSLTKWLIDNAKNRRSNVEELQNIINIIGGNPIVDGTFLGKLHHIWIDLKAQWTDDSIEALLDECIRGEEKALEDYTEVIAVNIMPDYARNILENQKNQIIAAIEDLRLLKVVYMREEEIITNK